MSEERPMTCPKCGAENRREAVFCAACEGDGAMATILIVEDHHNLNGWTPKKETSS